ncbi:MAG: hypothetical protein ACWA41_07220 [Putridiphycobacter sp.]
MADILNKILDHSFEYAKELLVDTMEFYPFGAYIDTIDNVHPLEFDYDKKNQPTVETVLNSIEKYCVTELKSDNMKIYALTYESEVVLEENGPTLKCITVEVKGHEDYPIFYQPYSISEENELKLDEIFAVKK